MESIVKTVTVTDGITMKVKDKDGVLIADRIVSDGEEVFFVAEVDRDGKKEKKVKKKKKEE